MKIVIRKAKADDAAVLALLAQVSFREAFSHFWTDEEVLPTGRFQKPIIMSAEFGI